MKSNYMTNLIFACTLIIVCISLISLLMPALLISSTIGTDSQTNPYEIGAWLVPFLIPNLVICGLAILYFKKLLPKKISNTLNFILKFEISQKKAKIIFAIILGGYIVFTVGELSQNELDFYKDWIFIQKVLDNYPYGATEEGLEELEVLHVKNFLLFISQQVFQNVKLIPFVASILLISLTYFLTVEFTQKRFAGIISMIILIQSQTFLRYDTSATFSNFWTLFYIISLFLIFKKWPLSPISFIASIFSKPLTVAFLPLSLLITARSKLPKKKKVSITIAYAIIIVGILAVLFSNVETGYGANLTSFDYNDFWTGFTSWAFQLRIDGLVLVFLLPLTIGLFFKARAGIREAEFILILLGGILLSVPLLAAFTGFNIQPYRWIPLITFFAIGVGVLLSKHSEDGPVN